MPFELRKTGDGWVVRNADTGLVKGRFKGNKEKASKQLRLLEAIKHGYRPGAK